MQYGLGYMGSKSKLADKIGHYLPSAACFVDLFAGGCAMTDWAMQSGKYRNFIANDLRKPSPVDLFKNAIDGIYAKDKFQPEWISREKFHELKEVDPYVKYIWSFGNNGKGYIFGKDSEVIKKAGHDLVVNRELTAPLIGLLSDEFVEHLILEPCINQRRMALNREAGRNFELQQLEQLQQLERLERLERLEVCASSYQDVNIPDDCIIYCDPPYFGTAGYDKNLFNHDEFWQWCRDQKHSVFVSEYTAPSDFIVVAEIMHRSTLSGSSNTKNSVENLYWNGKGAAPIISRLI